MEAQAHGSTVWSVHCGGAMRITVNCSRCGQETVKRSDHLALQKHAYCSKTCSSAARRVVGARWKDPEQIKQYMRDYVAKNRTRHNAASAQWARNNRDKRNELQQARRSAYAGHFSRSQWLGIKKAFGFICLRCRKPETLLLKLEPDHVVPVARGGSHHPSNIQPLCRSCNAWKGAKTIDYRDGVMITEVPA